MAISISDICAVVPAAGFGRRMQIKYPKQYLSVGSRTILEHTVEVLLSNPRIARVVIAINPNDTHFATLMLANHPKITTVIGGKKRTDSVLAGIQAAGELRWVLVHDAVRPCLHQDDLERLLAINNSNKVGVVLATPLRDTVKCTESGKNNIAYTIDRVNVWRALTPQLFPRKLLYNCLLHTISKGITTTDEASSLEYCGFYPQLVRGRADNIKVTYPEDLQFVKFYLTCINQQKKI